VPYKGAAPALLDLTGQRIDFMFLDLATGRSQLNAGRLKVLAVATRQRLSAFPSVPTLAESGVQDFEAVAWQGIVAPTGTKSDAIGLLNREITRALKTPEVQRRFIEAGITPFTGTADELGSHVRQEAARWSAIVRKADIKVE
jgi:tripartite-type tricarboxylate transporter receptor subunit TctC